MCRIGAIKSKNYFHPSRILQMMQSMQKGHDNSGFAMVMQDLGGIFNDYKKYPLLSFAGTDTGLNCIKKYMEEKGFKQINSFEPTVYPQPQLDIQKLPKYVFINYDYPEGVAQKDWDQKKELLTNTRLALRSLLEQDCQGFVYSFWPDVLTLKEIGDPRDIGSYFGLWNKDDTWVAKIITAQCRQNTNYEIVRYAAHPFFLQGYTLMANGENTFYQKNKDFQCTLHAGYIGFESDSQCFLYTLHYVCDVLKWPLTYYKHVITPLPFNEIEKRSDKDVLISIRQALPHLEINGPNTVIGVLPDGTLVTASDAKKLRPIVVGRSDDEVIMASEVCGINTLLPDRNWEKDIYPDEREIIYVTNDLEVKSCRQ